jgi:hypothetical protein
MVSQNDVKRVMNDLLSMGEFYVMMTMILNPEGLFDRDGIA